MAYTNTWIGTLILEAEADPWQPAAWNNKQDRLQRLFAAMRADDGTDAEKAALELVRMLLEAGAPANEWADPKIWWHEVIDAVAADGWEYDADAKRLIPTVPGVRVAEEASAFESALRERGWTTAAGHYKQALKAFAASHWASANSQLRSLVEAMIPAAAEFVAGRPAKGVVPALEVLRANDVLLDGEFGFAKGLWSMFQSQGSHPGLSHEDEARFRLMTATSYCRFLLSRLPE